MKTEILPYLLAVIAGFFITFFLWGFLDMGVMTLGINATVGGILILSLFFLSLKNKKDFFKKNYYWFIPLLIIVLSYSIYEIPFLKSINVLLMPLLCVFFFSYASAKTDHRKEWNFSMIPSFLYRKLSAEKHLKEVVDTVNTSDDTKILLYKKVLTGVTIFILLNVVIAYLLASADENFGNFIGSAGTVLTFQNVTKTILAIGLSIILLSFSKLWSSDETIEIKDNEGKIDAVIGGIVLSGTLFTYLVFIFIQIDSLFLNGGISNVEQISSLAKNGFWQLFLVSIINVSFFFVFYKKTTDLIQKILGVFTCASLIILFSAASKMYTYVSLYGLSYEKFFASYTIIYLTLLFISMISYIILSKKSDILKTSIILALWMYAGIHILPSELFIYKVNASIQKEPNLPIQKYQSHMLSIDILQSVEKTKGTDIYTDGNWTEWKEKKIEASNKKFWYEKNLQDFRIK